MTAQLQKYCLYCDESSTSDRFTVIGATLLHESLAEHAQGSFDTLIDQFGGSSELKWTKCKRLNLPLYKEITSAYFKCIQSGHFKYQALVIDNSKMDHKTYNEGDKEIGFNKMLFFLLYSFVRKFRNRPRFYAFLDERTTKHSPDRLRRMLNARALRDHQITHNPYRLCQFRDSKALRMIQITDIITGAIAFQTNHKQHAIGTAQHKIELANHIMNESGQPTLALPTPTRELDFGIWHFDFERASKSGSRASRR